MNTRIAAKASVLASLALIGTLSACSFSASASTTKSIDGDKLAGTIGKALTEQNPDLTITGTTCDDTPKIVTGGTTSCTASVDGTATTFLVTWKNTQGDYSVASVDA